MGNCKAKIEPCHIYIICCCALSGCSMKKTCGPLSQKENRNVKADWPMDKWPSGLKPSDRFTKS